MDLIAYQNKQNELIEKYMQKNYGDIPRSRGVRFMKIEKKVDGKPNIDVVDILEKENVVNYDKVKEMFNKYVGQDVIYIHTRCGNCSGSYTDKNSNYNYYGAKDWEEEHKELFLEHITDPFDSTYCTHYFKAVIDDDYKKIIKEIKK